MDLTEKLDAILEHPNAPLSLALSVMGKRGAPATELISSPVARMSLYHSLDANMLSAPSTSLLRDMLKIIMRLCEHEIFLSERAQEQASPAREVYELCWAVIIRLRNL
ncbi:hypothetical protein ACFQPG_07365 [Sphingomonas sp. GCM10030256]|uniref:hypothetical protein n=1 Tax=Sphingomonas sp. GCM10030256 TaxID=3273427 RepID=UPI00360F1256